MADGIYEMNLNRERDQRALRREHERERAEAAAETARLLVQQGLTPEVIVEDNAILRMGRVVAISIVCRLFVLAVVEIEELEILWCVPRCVH